MKQAADEWYGHDTTAGAAYGSYVDREGWEWQVYTDGNGQLKEPERVRFVGTAFYCWSERKRDKQLQREKEAAQEKWPDVWEAVECLLELEPMTAKELAKVTGRSHQGIIDIVNRLKERGKVDYTYTTRNGPMTEHLWHRTGGRE